MRKNSLFLLLTLFLFNSCQYFEKQVPSEKELLQKELDEKNDLLAQYREHLRQGKIESETSRKTILDLQNQLFESQIELVKANKNHIEKDVFKSIEDKMKLD